jgi:hypothetical protein
MLPRHLEHRPRLVNPLEARNDSAVDEVLEPRTQQDPLASLAVFHRLHHHNVIGVDSHRLKYNCRLLLQQLVGDSDKVGAQTRLHVSNFTT